MVETVWDEVFETSSEDEVQEEPQQEREEVSTDTFGLMHLGYLTETIEIFGHKINIRTLKVGEELEAELLVKKYKDTNEENRAYATALVAACIQSIDGAPLVQGLGPAGETLERRFYYITENWHWVTVEAVYIGYRSLAERMMTSLEEVKKG